MRTLVHSHTAFTGTSPGILTIPMRFADPRHIIAQCGLRPGMRVADFGAGAGYFAVEVAEVVGNEGVVYVIDIQQDLLTKATHLVRNEREVRFVFIHGDLEQPCGSTLPDTSVDMVIVTNLLFQVEDKMAVLSEAHRILTHDGHLLLIDWSDSYGGMGPHEEHVVPESEACTLLAKARFEPERTIDAGAYHYGLLCRTYA